MDSRSFDNWTRNRAVLTDRRKLLGWSLIAGFAGALSRLPRTAAQFEGNDDGCAYGIELTSTITVGATVTGTLEFEISESGAIDSGALTLQSQSPASIVGQATGPALDLVASLADGSVLSLIGLGSGPISGCPESIGGILANAGTGQLGTWTATSTSSLVSTPTPTPVLGSGSTSGSSSGQGTGAGQSPSSCPPTDCGQAFVLDQQSCQCVCAGGTVSCGANCCPSGSSCTDPGLGICGCPGGTVQCGIECVPECFGDEFLNFDTCQCETIQEPACAELGAGCANGGQCCSGWCNGGLCDSCGLRVCNDLCVDSSSDNNNCGNCNTPCFAPQTCIQGVCQG